jgi:hypothetical protein
MDRGVLGAARVWWGGGVLKSVSGKKDSRMQENSVMLLGSSKAPVSPLHVATSCACPIRSPSTSTSKPETHEITQGSPGRGDGGGLKNKRGGLSGTLTTGRRFLIDLSRRVLLFHCFLFFLPCLSGRKGACSL